MEFGGMNRDAKLAGDDLVGRALGQQRQHIKLAGGQLDIARFASRASIARNDRDACGFARQRQPQACNAAKQRSHPVCEFGIVDLDGHDDRRRLAHASGLSPMVSLKCTGWPARLTATSTTEPTLSGLSARASERTPDSLSSLRPVITSPCLMPAAAAGPCLSTFITMAPTPSSSLTGCNPTPR